MKRFSIGVDPGKDTGFAVYDREEKCLIEVKTTDFWSLVNDIECRFPPDDVHRMVIELPNSKTVWHKMKNKEGVHTRVGNDVGGVMIQAKLLIEWGKRKGYSVQSIHPIGKIKADRFKKLTGWEGRTNQHTRDAGMMCYGL